MKKHAEVEKEQCVACGCCSFVCPRGAISIPDGIFARVDKNKCVGCGLCAKACPASIIELKEEEGTAE